VLFFFAKLTSCSIAFAANVQSSLNFIADAYTDAEKRDNPVKK
jgi:hypothetical protein